MATKSTKDGVGLSAPWYELQRIISYSIGQSAQVSVSELSEINNGNYQITVTTWLDATAKALANTLKLVHDLGNITVTLIIKDLDGNTYQPGEEKGLVDSQIEDLRAALVNNPLVFGIEEFMSKASICCTPSVIQFWNDNISNPYSFSSMLASDAFKRVFLESIPVYTLGKTIGNF